MSSIRDPAYITDTGQTMMTAGGDITYTKAVLYGQDISNLRTDQIKALTTIGNPLRETQMGVSGKKDTDGHTTVILEATFQNNNLKADMPYTAVGFFAKKDDKEKLVAVAVANKGAYLAATSPDGVATDALDLKLAITIGDSANVTAMIDPAGSVTPAALHNAITDVKSEMKTGLDTKADKSTVDSDVKSINDTLATKADKQTVTDDLVKKADKTDFDAQIGTVNKSVSDLSDTVKANKDDTDKVLATKADKATVESELSTKANQSDLDKTNAEVAKKASTTDVNSQLATKADAKDVTDALALKDDTVDVDKKISNVTNSVNSLSSTVTSNKSATDTALGTKANANDVANSFEEVRNRVKKLEGQQELTAPDFNTLTSTGIYMIENPTNGKNSPSNGNWGTLVVSRGTTGSDSRILQEYYPDSGDLPYFRMSGPGGVWRDWKQLSDQSEINSLRDAVNTKADKTDVAKDIDTVNKSISSMSATITANQKATDTALDTKADKTTVNQELATKANSTDVNDKLAAKADSADVTKQIKTITDLANTKADQTALDATNATVATKANSTDVYTKTDTDKLLDAKADKAAVEQSLSTKANSADVDKKLDKKADKSSIDAKINAIDFSKIKFRKQRVNSDGQAADTTWSATKNSDGSYTIDIYQDDWTAYKVASLLRAITTKADQSSLDATNKVVATKANSSDVYTKKQVDDAFSSRDATIATKADKATVDAEISKIDFTPYAKTADVNKEIKTVTDLANTKVGADYSYSKAELDKKLLALSTDTSGKVNASQVASMIAGKADKTDVDQKIATVNKSVSDLSDTVSANKTATDASLATKANASDVADNVKTLQANIDTKADKATVDAEIAKIDFTPYAKTVDVDSKLSGYTSTADLTKLLNAKANTVDVYSRSELDKKLLEMSADTDGKVNADQVANMIAGKADKTAVDAELAKKDDITDVDSKINSNVTKINQAINTKANASDVYTKPQIDKAFGQRDTKIGNNTNVINTINEALKSLIPDDTHAPALPAGFDLNNYFVGWRRSVNTTLKNMPFGWLNDTMYFQGTVAGSDGRFELALYIGNRSNTNPKIAYRFYGWGNWKPWVLLADNGDISNLQNQITNATNLANQASQKVDTTFANSFVRKQGMNANGDCVEIKHTGIKQANGGYAFDMWSDDWTASKLNDVIKNKLPSKADKSQINVSGNLFNHMTDDSTWKAITGVDNTDNAILTSIRDDSPSGGNTTGGNGSAIAFGGSDTKAVLSVNWLHHEAKITSGNGSGPKWVEDVAWKSDVTNLQNQVNTKASASDVNSLNQTISALQQTVADLKNTVNQQATQITGLQTLVNNQANEIKQLQETTIKGKTFSKSQEAAAEAWEKQNSQQIAFITDN